MTYKRQDLAVQVNIKSIKGYTMKEIGALEDRIRRLEYYTVLNALELDTKTTSVTDASGNFERFKNGIFADPFNDHNLGKVNDSEYSIAVSSERSIARPTFEQIYADFKLKLSSSTNVKASGRLLTIDFTNEVFAENKFATTYRNCTEAYYNWKGYLRLFPNIDNANQITNAAPQNVTVDIAGAFSALLATGIAQDIDTVTGPRVLTGSQTTQTPNGGSTVTNYFSQTTAQTVTDIKVNVNAINHDLGNFVKDVSILPYMRSRIISIAAVGLRPGIRVYPFFDGVAVSKYCTPAKVATAYSKTNGSIDNAKLKGLAAGKESTLLTPTGVAGDPIIVNSRGEAYCMFLLPADTFRSGDRTFILTNVDDIAAKGAIITSAEGVYSSSSLAVTQQQLSFTVLQPSFTPVSTVTYSTSNSSETTVFEPAPQTPPGTWGDGGGDGGGGGDGAGSGGGDGGGGGNDPVGQSFMINVDKGVAIPGIYLTQVGLYFKKKSPTLGITCVIAGMTAGTIDRSKVLGRCHLDSSDVSVSNDSSSETVFSFESPILLQSDTEFAFYVIPDGDNPDYEIWISEVGGNDKLTGRAVNQQPYLGVMFVSSNGRTWNPIQSSDVKFKLYRARFTSPTATAVFTNEQDEYLTLTSVNRFKAANAISIGDVVYAANASNLNQILSNTSVYPFGIVQYVDELNGELHLDSSNGRFNTTTYKNLRIYRVPEVGNTAYLTNTYLIANAVLGTIDDKPYHGIVPKFNMLEPIGTLFTMNFRGTANSARSFNKDSTSLAVKNETLFEVNDYERVLRSYSNERARGGYTDGTSTFTVNFRASNPYLSPVIDLSAKTFSFIKNRINNSITNENTRFGDALNKYVSKNVVLEQEAEDIRVYVTGYRPKGTNIYVYVKFLNSQDDPDIFDQKSWTLLRFTSTTSNLYSSPQNKDDYKELVYEVGSTTNTTGIAYLDPATTPAGILTYYNSTGSIIRNFDTFSLKMVFVSSNPVLIPTARDIRAIALQK